MLFSRSLRPSSLRYHQESSPYRDFNVCVGSRESVDEEWSGVRAPHGFGQTNDSGRELLSFLSLQCSLVQKELHGSYTVCPQTDMAASEVQALELY